MDKILVSACLLGEKTRYDGKDNLDENLLAKLKAHYEIIPFCPEVEGGLGVPRLKSEIRDGRVVNEKGEDVTSQFVSGAEKAVEICRFLSINLAILKDGSPSCGCRRIHDGKFTGNKIDGLGIAAQKLIEAGVTVYADSDNLDFLFKEPKRSTHPYYRDNPAEHKRSSYRKKGTISPRKKVEEKEEPSKVEARKTAAKPRSYRPKKDFRSHGPAGEGTSRGQKDFHGKKKLSLRKSRASYDRKTTARKGYFGRKKKER